MKKLIDQFRCYICEVLMGWIMFIAPDTLDGMYIQAAIIAYIEASLEAAPHTAVRKAG